MEQIRIDLRPLIEAATAVFVALGEAALQMVRFAEASLRILVATSKEWLASPAGLRFLAALHLQRERLVSPGIEVEWANVSDTWMKKY
jgi:hypothetical protein